MQTRIKITEIIYLILLTSLVTGCTSSKSKGKLLMEFDPPRLEAGFDEANKSCGQEELAAYSKALQLFEKKKYSKAADAFAEVYYSNPGSRITPYAELMEAYSHYLISDYSDCANILDNFIKFYPTHPDIEWAHYLKIYACLGQSVDVYYDQNDGGQLPSQIMSFLAQFPNSKYSADLANKLQENILLQYRKERYIAHYYLITRNNPIAAIGRFRLIANSENVYQDEALYRLFEIYLSLNMPDEANFYATELSNQFPNSPWNFKISKRG